MKNRLSLQHSSLFYTNLQCPTASELINTMKEKQKTSEEAYNTSIRHVEMKINCDLYFCLRVQ